MGGHARWAEEPPRRTLSLPPLSAQIWGCWRASATSQRGHSPPALPYDPLELEGFIPQARELVLGPFQGKPACVRIALGRGVCGTAAEGRRTVVVENVHEFPGHIACDGASNSEIVVPLLRGGRLVGVLDLDSPALARFDAEDRAGLERLAEIFLDATDVDEFTKLSAASAPK